MSRYLRIFIFIICKTFIHYKNEKHTFIDNSKTCLMIIQKCWNCVFSKSNEIHEGWPWLHDLIFCLDIAWRSIINRDVASKSNRTIKRTSFGEWVSAMCHESAHGRYDDWRWFFAFNRPVAFYFFLRLHEINLSLVWVCDLALFLFCYF